MEVFLLKTFISSLKQHNNMKKTLCTLAFVLVAFVTLTAKTTASATITPFISAEFPHAFQITNLNDDSIVIEYVIISCITDTQASVQLFARPQRHLGSIGSKIIHREVIPPYQVTQLCFLFSERIPASMITVSIMVTSKRTGEHYFIYSGQPSL